MFNTTGEEPSNTRTLGARDSYEVKEIPDSRYSVNKSSHESNHAKVHAKEECSRTVHEHNAEGREKLTRDTAGITTLHSDPGTNHIRGSSEKGHFDTEELNERDGY